MNQGPQPEQLETGALIDGLLQMPVLIAGMVDHISDGEAILPEAYAQSILNFGLANPQVGFQALGLNAEFQEAVEGHEEELANGFRQALNRDEQVAAQGRQNLIALLNREETIKAFFQTKLAQLQAYNAQYRAYIQQNPIVPQRDAHNPVALPGVGLEVDGPQVDMATYNARLQHHLQTMGLAESWQRTHEDGRRMIYAHGDNQVAVDLTRGFSAKARNNSEDSINMLIASAKAYQDALGPDNRHEFTITCDDEATAHRVIAKLQEQELDIGAVRIRNPENQREYMTLPPERVEELRRQQPQPRPQPQPRGPQEGELDERLDDANDRLRQRVVQQEQAENARRRNVLNHN